MGPNLFAYGTLIIQSVLEAVTQRSFTAVDGYLDGYARFTLRDRPYPGIILAAGGSVDGRVYLDLDEEALERLRYFEDACYQQAKVAVTLDNQSTVAALAFVVPPESSELLTDLPWSLKKFRTDQLPSYLKNVRKYMQDYRRAR